MFRLTGCIMMRPLFDDAFLEAEEHGSPVGFTPCPVRPAVQQVIDVLRGKIVLSRPLGNAESALGKGVLYAFPERQRNVRPSSVCLVHNPSLSCAPSRFRVGVVLEVVVFCGSLE